VDDVLCIRIYGAEDTGEYLEGQPVLQLQLEPEAALAEAGQSQLAQILGRYPYLLRHTYIISLR
jgi:hypothetical protein